MKRLLLVWCLVVLAGAAFAAETTIPSIAQVEEPYFDGIGFCLKADAYVVAELHIVKVQQVNLKSEDAPKMLKGIFVFGATPYPVKIIKPELDEFEADIVEVNPNDKKLVLPVGHISFKLEKPDKIHTTAVGQVIIKVEDEDKSGQHRLLLNEISPKKGGKPGDPPPAAPPAAPGN